MLKLHKMITLHVFIAKVLVTTGYPLENGYHSEVIDLLNPNSTCDSLPDFPVQIHSGIIDNILNFCGLIQYVPAKLTLGRELCY